MDALPNFSFLMAQISSHFCRSVERAILVSPLRSGATPRGRRTRSPRENINLLLVSVVMRGPGTLTRLEDRIARDQFVRWLRDIEHQEHVLAFQMANPLFVLSDLLPTAMKDRVRFFGRRAANN